MRSMLKDKDIREPLFDFLEGTYGRIRIIEEKTMGAAKTVIFHKDYPLLTTKFG